MLISKWESPYPLLAHERDDYAVGSFEIVEGKHSIADNEFVFRFGYMLDCPGLETYIRQGKARVILHVSSRAAKFRRKYKFSMDETSLQLHIPKDELVKNVELTAYVVSTGDDSFSLPEHNAEYYGGATFKLRKGDILAESVTIVVSLDDSELQKPLSSIFQIEEAPEDFIDAIIPYFQDDKIKIYLLSDLYKKYATLRRDHGSLRRNLSAIITLPVLVEAIEIMVSDEAADYENLRWYKALANRLAQNGINLEEPSLSTTTIANKIYGNLVLDAMATIQYKLDDIANNSEMQELGGID